MRPCLLSSLRYKPYTQAAAEAERIINELQWTGPVHRISALKKDGTKQLAGAVMTRLEQIDKEAAQAAAGDQAYDPRES